MILLDPGEHVLLEVRKHWFVFVAQGIFHLFAAFVPFFAYEFIVKRLPYRIPDAFNPTGLSLFFYSLWLLSLWISFFVQWTNYYLDVWYVTEKRIIDVEQKALFNRSVASLRFEKIQDISIDVRGFISTFLNIGDIRVQTAAEDSGDFFMRKAASPDNIRNIIFAQHNVASEKFIPHPPSSISNAPENTENFI